MFCLQNQSGTTTGGETAGSRGTIGGGETKTDGRSPSTADLTSGEIAAAYSSVRKESMRASQIFLPTNPLEHKQLLEKFLESKGFPPEYRDKIRRMDPKTQSKKV